MGADFPRVERAVMVPLEGIGERLAAGGALTGPEAQQLLETKNLIAVGALADEVRARVNGGDVTFLRVLDVAADGPLPSIPDGTGEVRIAGLRPDAPNAEARVREVVSAAGAIPVTACALHEMTGELAGRLRRAGLSMVATALVDRLLDTRLVDEVRGAGLDVARWTVDSYDPLPPLDLFERVQRLGDLRCFAPLPETIDLAVPTTGYDDVKLIALARAYLPNVTAVSVDWSRYGPKLAQVALTFGAADLDGVAAAEPAGANLLGPRRTTIEEVKRNILAAARRPVPRNAKFEPLETAGPATAAL